MKDLVFKLWLTGMGLCAAAFAIEVLKGLWAASTPPLVFWSMSIGSALGLAAFLYQVWIAK